MARKIMVREGCRDRKIRIYPTLRCNMQCTYCSNGVTLGTSLPTATLENWVIGTERLGSAVEKKENEMHGVFFTGGEPTLYPRLLDFINAVPEGLGVMLYTNLTNPMESFVRGLRRPIEVRGSIHAPGSVEVYRANVEVLRTCSHVERLVLTLVAGTPAVVQYLRYFNNIKDVSLKISDNQWFSSQEHKLSGVPQRVVCKNFAFLYGPDGARYPCVSHMKRGWRSPEPMFWETDWGQITDEVRTECSDFGCCTACDGLLESEVEFIK